MPFRFFFVGVSFFFASGCSEGTKANPLPRARTTAPQSTVKTLYERLGRETGLSQVVNQLITNLNADPATTALAGRIKKRVLIDFLIEVSSKPRTKLADEMMIGPADWALLIPALRAALNAQGIRAADRDELLVNIENSR